MANKTEKFGLIKPEWTDPFLEPETTSQNMDIIENALGELNAAVAIKADEAAVGDLSSLGTLDKSSVVNAVNEVKEDLDQNVTEINDSITMINQQINISGTVRGLCSSSQSVNEYNNSDYFGVWVMNSQQTTLKDLPISRTSMEAVYLEVQGMGMAYTTMNTTQKIKQIVTYTTQNLTYVRYRNGDTFSNWFLVDEHPDNQKRPYVDKAVSIAGDKVLAMNADGKINETGVHIKSLLKHNLDGTYYLNEDIFEFTDDGWQFKESGYKRAYSTVSKWNGIDCLVSEYSNQATQYEGLLTNNSNGISAPVLQGKNHLEILNICSGTKGAYEDLPCTRTVYYNTLTPKLSGNAIYSQPGEEIKVYLHLLKDFISLREVGSKYSVTFSMCYGTYINGSSFTMASMFGTRVLLNHLEMGKSLRMFVKNNNANSYIYQTPSTDYLPIENNTIKSYTLTLEYATSSSCVVTLTDGQVVNTCTTTYDLLSYYNSSGEENYLSFNSILAFSDVYEEIARKGRELLGPPQRTTYNKNVLHYLPNIGALSLVNNHDIKQWHDAAHYTLMQKYYPHEPGAWKLQMTPEEYFTITSEGTINAYSGSYDEAIVVPPKINGITVKKLVNNNTSDPIFKEPVQRLVIPNTVEQSWDLLVGSELVCGEFYCPSSLKRFSLTIDPSFVSSTLKKVVLNDGLEELGDDGFTREINLKSIVIPKSMKIIGVVCFAGASMDIYYEGSKEEWEAIEKQSGAFSGWTGKLYCRDTKQPDGMGDLSALATTDKNSIVDSINEIVRRLEAIE